MTQPHVLILSDQTFELASSIKSEIEGTVHGYSKRTTKADSSFDDVKSHIQKLFRAGTPIIAIMASGALIRILAPLLDDKHNEPPVIAIAEDGSSVVPLLGGHHGANKLARKIAAKLQTTAAITTAGDLKFGIALDQPTEGLVLANWQDAKAVMAALVAGGSAILEGESEWLTNSDIPFDTAGNVKLTVTDEAREPSDLELIYHPRTLVLGLGCERNADGDEVIALAEQALNGLSPKAIACVASIDLKADETALHLAANHFGVEARFFPAEVLEAESDRLENPSDIVFSEVGCHGVSEGAALAASGSGGEMIVPKIKSKRATAAIARSQSILSPEEIGRSRGRLFVVGIGPGQDAWRSPEVTRMIGDATDLVGYSLYLDLITSISAGKIRHDFDLGKEEDRVRHAMELAGTGKDVALVCSGDAGIYAMATLVFELLAHGGLSDGANRIAIEVSPGISALQAAAARAGAPLGHDFCTISLSDLLTPWEAIQMRLKGAAEGDFVIAFYNPVSKRRRTQLAYAKEILLKHRPADTPVILASNLGRDQEKLRIVPLSDLLIDDVDMLTVVIVGSSETRCVKTGDGRNWVYTPRGYSAKSGTNINPQIVEKA
ncbi:MAG: precorrin-3B C(17)-methyltransferase [Rhizobiaceae bacterium]